MTAGVFHKMMIVFFLFFYKMRAIYTSVSFCCYLKRAAFQMLKKYMQSYFKKLIYLINLLREIEAGKQYILLSNFDIFSCA